MEFIFAIPNKIYWGFLFFFSILKLFFFYGPLSMSVDIQYNKLFLELLLIIRIIYMQEFQEKAKDVYTNFQLSDPMSTTRLAKPISETLHFLLLGKCGVGKSFFINNFCGVNQETGTCRKSLTKKLYEVHSIYDKNMIVCDSPGITSDDLQGATIIQKAIKYLPWNLLLIQAKLDPRFDYHTLPDLKSISRLFQKDQDRVIFLISCLDISRPGRERQDILRDIAESLDEHQIRQKVILYSNINSDFSALAQILFECGVEYPIKNFQFEEKKLCNLFGLRDIPQTSLKQMELSIMRPENRPRTIMLINDEKQQQTHAVIRREFHSCVKLAHKQPQRQINRNFYRYHDKNPEQKKQVRERIEKDFVENNRRNWNNMNHMNIERLTQRFKRTGDICGEERKVRKDEYFNGAYKQEPITSQMYKNEWVHQQALNRMYNQKLERFPKFNL